MFVTITSSKVTKEQGKEVERFLEEFLPRLQQQQPGVVASFHYARPEKGDQTTIIVWENEEAVRAYRTGELIKEPIAMEKRLNVQSTREGYPLTYGTGLGQGTAKS